MGNTSTHKRAFVIVLDSLGCGSARDSADYGDEGANTLGSILQAQPELKLPNLASLGLGAATGMREIDAELRKGTCKFSVLQEESKGKDTTTGHWELMGLVLREPFPLFPEGFPEEVLKPLKSYAGRGVLCNKPASGTEIINELGAQHMQTEDLIVYTSGDSVFQIAAHEEIVPLSELYDICQYMRDEVLVGKYCVGRVISRPFTGTAETGFVRTGNRRDFGVKPFSSTVLDHLISAGVDVTGVGKISDIFSAQGLSASVSTHSNEEGMAATAQLATTQKEGLIFTNLVDFDMLWGHRRDSLGYAHGLEVFDEWLGDFLDTLTDDDLLVITADHGCDPRFKGTDHTREFVPALWYCPYPHAKILIGGDTFSTVGQSIEEWLAR